MNEFLREYQNFCYEKQRYTDLLLAVGLGGETGEVLEIYKKAHRDYKPIDKEHLKEELGDVLWYVANICTSQGLTLEEVIENNIKKLKERYDYDK